MGKLAKMNGFFSLTAALLAALATNAAQETDLESKLKMVKEKEAGVLAELEQVQSEIAAVKKEIIGQKTSNYAEGDGVPAIVISNKWCTEVYESTDSYGNVLLKVEPSSSILIVDYPEERWWKVVVPDSGLVGYMLWMCVKDSKKLMTDVMALTNDPRLEEEQRRLEEERRKAEAQKEAQKETQKEAQRQRDIQYDRYFGAGWKWSAVKGGEVTLLTDADDYPCYLKAYGWKVLDTKRKKRRNDPWYLLGDEYVKWGYKIIVTANPNFRTVEVMKFPVALKSTEGFTLDEDSFLWIGNSERKGKFITPGQTEVIQATREYNKSNKSGEGEPSSIYFRTTCVAHQ